MGTRSTVERCRAIPTTTQPQPQLLRRCAHGARVAGGIHGVIEAQAIGAGAAVVLIRGDSVRVFGPAAGAIRARAPIRVGVTRLVALAAIAVIIDLVQNHDHKDDDDDRHDELQDAGDEQHHARRREFARSLLDFLWGAAHEHAGGDAGEQPANRPDYAGEAAREADQREDGTASQARFWLSGAHAIPKVRLHWATARAQGLFVRAGGAQDKARDGEALGLVRLLGKVRVVRAHLASSTEVSTVVRPERHTRSQTHTQTLSDRHG